MPVSQTPSLLGVRNPCPRITHAFMHLVVICLMPRNNHVYHHAPRSQKMWLPCHCLCSRRVSVYLCIERTSSLETAHEPLPQIAVHNASNSERRHDATHSCEAAGHPVLPDYSKAILHSRPAVAIVQIQAQQVERRRDELNGRRSQELRGRSA